MLELEIFLGLAMPINDKITPPITSSAVDLIKFSSVGQGDLWLVLAAEWTA